MKYTKPVLSIDQQIDLLKSRNLIIEDEIEAKTTLSNISYYRLSSYLFPYRIVDDTEQNFQMNTNFKEIIKVYSFDRKLRLLIFDAIERIEIAFRTQLTLNLSFNYGSDWYFQPQFFQNSELFEKTIKSFKHEYSVSKEVFIEHYKRKYSEPELPPSWIGLEIFTFGQLSGHYSNLKDKRNKQLVADYFHLKYIVFESWLHSISYVRNICAHHARLWNRSLGVRPVFPNPKHFGWLMEKDLHNNRLYYFLYTVQYLLDFVHPKNNFRLKLKGLISDYSNVNLATMGFPANWQNEEFWNLTK